MPNTKILTLWLIIKCFVERHLFRKWYSKCRSEKFSLEPDKIGYIFGFMIRLKQGFYYSLRTLTKTIFKKCKTVSNQVKLVNHLQQVQCSIYTLSSFYPDIFFETIYLDLDRTSRWPLLALVDSNLLKYKSRFSTVGSAQDFESGGPGFVLEVQHYIYI